MTFDLDSEDLAQLEAVMHTDKGDMVLRFHPEHAPKHVHNFLDLAQKGFYDGTAFHRIIRGFMIQGGCPNTKDDATGTPGTGGYTEENESGQVVRRHVDAEFNDMAHERGVVSMARAMDPNSASSQFFVCHDDCPALDGQYTAFARVVDGLDVLDTIASTEVESGAGGERSKPVERITLEGVTVRRIPADAGTDTDGDGDGDGGDS